MPTETFFRLPEDKQERILEAARVEFSRVPLQEASIAQIVKLADIPRGSFYQYFEDKEDLYYYYFELLRHSSGRDFVMFIEKYQGDLFAAFEAYFLNFIEEALKGKNAAFYKHMFMHMGFHGSVRVSEELTNEDQQLELEKKERRKLHEKHFISLVRSIDVSHLKISTENEVKMLMSLLMSILFQTINHAYRHEKLTNELDLEKIKEEFQTKLSWIKNGVYQEEAGGNE